MQSRTKTIEKKIAQLQEQQAGILAQLQAEETAIEGINTMQEELSVAAFTGNKDASERFEKLSSEADARQRRQRGLTFAKERIQEEIEGASQELVGARREDAINKRAALIPEREKLAAEMQAALQQFAATARRAFDLDREITAIGREVGDELARGSDDILRAQTEHCVCQELYALFPRMPFAFVSPAERIDLASEARKIFEARYQQPEEQAVSLK